MVLYITMGARTPAMQDKGALSGRFSPQAAARLGSPRYGATGRRCEASGMACGLSRESAGATLIPAGDRRQVGCGRRGRVYIHTDVADEMRADRRRTAC